MAPSESVSRGFDSIYFPLPSPFACAVNKFPPPTPAVLDAERFNWIFEANSQIGLACSPSGFKTPGGTYISEIYGSCEQLADSPFRQKFLPLREKLHIP